MTTAGAEPAPVRRNGSLKVGPLAAPTTPPIPAVTLIPAPAPAPAPAASDPEPDGTLIRGSSSDGGTTPTGIRRPTPEDLPDHEIDPGLMAAAMAELDAELSHRNDPEPLTAREPRHDRGLKAQAAGEWRVRSTAWPPSTPTR